MIAYLLKVSFVLGVAYLFYKAVLQQESYFAANRFYLIACIALAFALPFVSLPRLVHHQGYVDRIFENAYSREHGAPAQQLSQPRLRPAEPLAPVAWSRQDAASITEPQAAATETQAQGAGEVSWMYWLSVLYLFGVGVFALNLLFQIGGVLFRALASTDKVEDGACVIVNTAAKQAPCSFFRYIFIHPGDYDYQTYEQIIAHEKIHARLGHSLDLLIAELAVILLWFNPLSWLLRKEIEKNNEYQTDATLLEQSTISKDQYQLSLVQIAVPHKPLSITTNYNQSLLKQRILMMNAKKSTLYGYWKYAFLAPLFFGTLLLINKPATSQELDKGSTVAGFLPLSKPDTGPERRAAEQESKAGEGIPQDVQPANAPVEGQGNTFNIKGAQADMGRGYWYSRRENGSYCIDFKGNQGAGGWNMSRCFARESFEKQAGGTYVMRREAGRLTLQGDPESEVSQGKYSFSENPDFSKYLTSQNITNNDKNFLFHLFFGNIDRRYVEYLQQNYKEVAGARLLELAIHGISLEEYQNYMALFDKYSQKKPSMAEVVEAKIHDIDQAYVEELQAIGFKGLSFKKMMEARIHGVNRAYVEELRKAGFTNLSIDKIIEAKIHGINPAVSRELQALGFGKLDLDEMISLQIHDVDASYIQELQSAGLGKLSLEQVVEAKIHGLDAASVKEIRGLGFKDLDWQEIMAAQIHGVDAAYVEELRKAGLQNLTISKAVEAKIHGIDSRFIKQAREKGYNFSSVDKYVALKIHGMAIESLKE